MDAPQRAFLQPAAGPDGDQGARWRSMELPRLPALVPQRMAGSGGGAGGGKRLLWRKAMRGDGRCDRPLGDERRGGAAWVAAAPLLAQFRWEPSYRACHGLIDGVVLTAPRLPAGAVSSPWCASLVGPGPIWC